MNRFPAVLFDLDGVLVETYKAWFHLLNAAATHWGFPPISTEIYKDIWGQGIQADANRFFHGKSVPEVETFYREHFQDHREHMITFPEGPEIFHLLREQNRGIAIITNTARQQALEVLQIAGLKPDILVGGTDVPHSKPAPDMIYKACEELNLSPEEVMVLGDSRYDREAARAAGTYFVGMKTEGDDTVQNLSEFEKRFVSIP
jgi:phosphoglycolate phosphatase/AHBA synthesis associated protein